MSYNDLIADQIANAFTNILGNNDLTEDIILRYMTGEGIYDVATDTHTPQQTDVTIENVVVTGVDEDDLKQNGVLSTDSKILIPGRFLTTIPQADTTKVIRSTGFEWDIRKVKQITGGGLVTIYIYRT